MAMTAPRKVRVRKVATPPELQALTVLHRCDYSGTFSADISPPTQHTPEYWLRAIFEHSPKPTRLMVGLGWRAFGAQLAQSSSPHTLAGWRVDESTADHVRMSVEWRLGLDASIALRIDGSTITVGTFVETNTRAAKLAWRAMTPIHEATLWLWFTLAARRLTTT